MTDEELIGTIAGLRITVQKLKEELEERGAQLERANADLLRVCRERNDTMKELRYAEGAYDQERRACKTYREQALALALERDKANAEIEARGERIHVMLDRALTAESSLARLQAAAYEAISHVERHNGPGRAAEARAIIRAALARTAPAQEDSNGR